MLLQHISAYPELMEKPLGVAVRAGLDLNVISVSPEDKPVRLIGFIISLFHRKIASFRQQLVHVHIPIELHINGFTSQLDPLER